MIKFSPKIYEAINKAATLHDGQERKGDGLPYIVHPFAVTLILLGYTSDEDVLIAGILHDTIEDTGYTKEQMRQDFGQRVTQFVLDVTEPPKPLPWQQRKDGYLQHLAGASHEAKLICAADKLHNLLSMLAALQKFGKGAYAHFNAPVDKKLWFYEECLKIINKEATMPKGIVEDIEKVLETINKLNQELDDSDGSQVPKKPILTPEQKKETDIMAGEFIDGLNRGAIESGERNERWEKIYGIEQTKWPHDMGNKSRSEIPKKFWPELDECIDKSQQIARETCQTEKLTEDYLKKNSKK
jgi:hypothetical protein